MQADRLERALLGLPYEGHYNKQHLIVNSQQVSAVVGEKCGRFRGREVLR